MALEGTIKDFGLADIFQLIGIQRKTGTLTLDNNREIVSVKFLEGQVVGAENQSIKFEDLLGSVLVRTGRIAQAQLDAALEIQKSTLQRLGFLIVKAGYLSEEDLTDALRTQVTQIVYRLFRWRDGSYRFDAADNMEYDQNFIPISAETILMEGARMVDEWPIIERKIKSGKMVFRKTKAASALEEPVESIVEADIDIDSVFHGEQQEEEAEAQEEDEGGIRLSGEEREIVRLVDGKSSVQEIVDRNSLGEFDTYRILHDLLTRNLIEEVSTVAAVAGAVPVKGSARLLRGALLGLLLSISLLSLASLSMNPYTPWQDRSVGSGTDRLRTYASRGRIERIERAIQLFFLDTGALPIQLELLVSNGYLNEKDTRDPWGRPYVFTLDRASYTLMGMDEQGQLSQELKINRRLSPMQRLILEDTLGGEN
jgi:hypothetical protein